MKAEEKIISEVMPEVGTTDVELSYVIRWADAHPVAWKIVRENRSVAFGSESSFYIGWARGSWASEAILERLRAFRGEIFAVDSIRSWRARFTLDHYWDAGFTGGLFQRIEKPRVSMTLDYTPQWILH